MPAPHNSATSAAVSAALMPTLGLMIVPMQRTAMHAGRTARTGDALRGPRELVANVAGSASEASRTPVVSPRSNRLPATVAARVGRFAPKLAMGYATRHAGSSPWTGDRLARKPGVGQAWDGRRLQVFDVFDGRAGPGAQCIAFTGHAQKRATALFAREHIGHRRRVERGLDHVDGANMALGQCAHRVRARRLRHR